MGLDTIGRMISGTRKKMIGLQAEEAADAFREEFSLGSGDFLRVEFWGKNNGSIWKHCRIMSIESCFLNSEGSYTGSITVAPINRDGSLGCTRRIFVIKGKNGKLKQLPSVPSHGIEVVGKSQS